MVGGGGSKKGESVVLNNSNVFAALDSLRKKKKKDGGSHKSTAAPTRSKEQEKGVFWAPAPLTSKSWADVDDEDEDDYFATTAPPVSVCSGDAAGSKVPVEESESEEEGLDEVDDVDEEHENEHELEAPIVEEPVVKKPFEAPPVPKDTERQLSKKELKKKGLEELDAVLAELGYAKQETYGQDDSHAITQQKKAEINGEEQNKEKTTGESKSAKKKKKEKSSKEVKESQDDSHGRDAGNGPDETAEAEKAEDASAVDVKERLKKVASTKKKKSSKEMDAAARAAASEAAARSVKFAVYGLAGLLNVCTGLLITKTDINSCVFTRLRGDKMARPLRLTQKPGPILITAIDFPRRRKLENWEEVFRFGLQFLHSRFPKPKFLFSGILKK